MDKQNISKSYLSISSPGVYLNVPSLGATKHATKLSRKVNEYAAELKQKYPERFGYFASLPLPDIKSSLAEIEHCFTKLQPKPDGVVLMSNAFGMYFGDPALDPVYEALNKLNVTIFEHPTTPCTHFNSLQYHTNSTAPPVTPQQWQSLNRPISDRQFATPTLDFPFDTARTFTDLFVSQIPSRFSSLKWIIPHAGGGILPTLDRVVTYSSLYPNLTLTEASMRKTLDEQFFFDLAGPWPVTRAIPALLAWVNYTRILWGSDTPWTPWAAGEKTADAFDGDVAEVFQGPNGHREISSVGHGNAEELFSSA